MAIAERRGRRAAWQRVANDAARDVRHALRGMRRRPVFTAGVVLTIGLATGAAAAVFAIVNGVLLRPLPYPSPERVYAVYSRYLPATGYDFEFFSVSGPEYDDYRALTRSMADVAVYGLGTSNLAPEGAVPERVMVGLGSASMLDVLGVAPVLGRGFTAGEDAPGRACVTVLSDGLWRERFGADASVVGREIRLDGRSCEVIGVMPRGFWFPVEDVRLWTTIELDRASSFGERESHPYLAVARLAPGATRATAEAELDALRERWAAAYPDHHEKGHFLVLRPFVDDVVGDTRPALLVLLGAVGIVLLIVCVNLAGLFLAAGEIRRREFAVRAALGVGRGRLARQVLTETVVFALAGAVIGIVAARVLLAAMLSIYPGGLPRGSEIGMDGRVLAFTVAVAVAAGLLFGAIPALRASGVRLIEALREAGRGLTAHRAGIEARQVFNVAQTALALVLVIGAALLGQSYARLRSVDLGFGPENALAFNVTVPESSRPDDAHARDYFTRLEERLAVLPGVMAAGAVSDLPLRSAGGADDFIIEGRPLPAPGEMRWNARYQMATPSALRALGLRLLSGRWFEPTDAPGSPPVAVINQATATQYYAGDDPVGRRIRFYGADGPDSVWITIVGVVGDVRSLGAAEGAPPAIFTALAQAPRPSYVGRAMNLVVRFQDRAAEHATAVRAAVAEVDASLPPSELTTLESVVTESLGRPRFTVTLISAFAALAMLLCMLGLYGVLAQSVQQRIQEIAIRLTLGAKRMQVVRMVAGQGLALVVLGTLVGLGTAVLLRSAIATLLFGVSALDPRTLAATSATVVLVSLAACVVPAWRATRVDPSVALRAQ